MRLDNGVEMRLRGEEVGGGGGGHTGWPFYAAVAASGGQLAWQIRSVDYNDREDCNAK